MKKIAILILMLIAANQLTMAQYKNDQAPEKPYAWNETTHDFGKLVYKVPATVTFTVENKGEKPLVITRAKSSCGCTVAEYTKEPIKPGESGIVKATYNSARLGKFTKTVIVTFDGITDGDVLTLKGLVEKESTE
jgi:hypothetical protein